MKTLYLECNMGAAGDMLTAALLELHPDKEAFVRKLNEIGIPEVVYEAVPSKKCGITGTYMHVTAKGETETSFDTKFGRVDYNTGEAKPEEACGADGQRINLNLDREHHHHRGTGEAGHEHDHEHEHEHDHEHDHGHGHHHHHHDQGHTHSHRCVEDIIDIVNGLKIPEKVKNDVVNVYRILAEAEGHVHGALLEMIHFHEVGNLDAIADITAVCLLMHELAPEKVIVSPIHVGHGHVVCAHGIIPIPAPATAWILRDVPTCSGDVGGELCTPTGAALLKYFADEFAMQPVMKVQAIGYGMGKKDLKQVNAVRAMLGSTGEESETIAELSCNLDDMTPEALAYASEQLMAAGALDVYTIPVVMKKGRPGWLLNCMCRMDMREEMIRLIFLHTTTLGVRENVSCRYTLERKMETSYGDFGEARIKKVSGWGVTREKIEYEDLAKIASERGISLKQAEDLVGKNPDK